LGGYFLTKNEAFLSPYHFILSATIAFVQVAVINKLFRREIEQFWIKLENSIGRILKKIRSIRKVQEVKTLREEKNNLLKPLEKDKSFQKLVVHLDHLLDEFLNIVELSLIKDDLVRKLTTTLNTKLLSQILANNIINIFGVPAVAVYLKNLRGEDYELKLNKGFSVLKPMVELQYAEKAAAKEGLIFEEFFSWKVDRGLCDQPVEKLLVFKLNPRKDKIIGFVFIGLDETVKPRMEKQLKSFLQELGTTVSLIFENALEHEKSIILASYDPLTGAYNRQEGLKAIRAMLKKAEFEHRNVCLLLLDIDHFKKINDTYGHDVGDTVLKEVVRVIRNSVRNHDIVVRWGGEEFLIAVENVPPEKAREIAERIRSNIERTTIVVNNNVKISVTVSIGVACTEKDGTYYFDELFTIADKRLYKAKDGGRNRVVVD
jgi:diguanylate cyclase (GGDEF)-like protein